MDQNEVSVHNSGLFSQFYRVVLLSNQVRKYFKGMASAHLARADRISGPIRAALAKNLINRKSPVCDLYDLNALRGRFSEVQTALPNWNHAVAIKVSFFTINYSYTSPI